VATALADLWRLISANGDEAKAFALIDELALSLTQMKTLMVLAHCPEALSVGEIADRLGLSLASASRTVENLQRRGWIERREDEHDRRMKRVSVSGAGHEIAGRIAEARLQGLETFAASLSAEQRTRLHTVITDLLETENAKD
jgi:DNA-binding MarR family transcriptional regulator